jgi:hypothetical protein
MRKTRFVFTLLALRVLATSVMQIAAQAQGRMLCTSTMAFTTRMAGHERNQQTPPMNQNNTLNLKVTNMAGDPDVGADKYLAVKYTCQGRAMSKVVKECGRLQLPETHRIGLRSNCAAAQATAELGHLRQS